MLNSLNTFLDRFDDRFDDRLDDVPTNKRIVSWFVISSLTFCGSIFISALPLYGIQEYSFVSVIIVCSILIFLYFGVFFLTISKFVERLLQRIHDVRHIATLTEKERLNPIFENVYKRLRNRKIPISPNIKLYIVDTMQINALSLSLTTIAVTRGLMEIMSDEELEAVIAHEFGHLYRGDPIATLLISMITTVYLWIAIGLKYLIHWLGSRGSEDGSAAGIWRLPGLAMNFVVAAVAFLGGLITGSISRKKEYEADMFAADLGYIEPLISALYKFYDLSISDKSKMLDRMQDSHPKVAYRIEALEENYFSKEFDYLEVS